MTVLRDEDATPLFLAREAVLAQLWVVGFWEASLKGSWRVWRAPRAEGEQMGHLMPRGCGGPAWAACGRPGGGVGPPRACRPGQGRDRELCPEAPGGRHHCGGWGRQTEHL